MLSEDHLKLLRNAVVWAMGEEMSPVQVEGPGLLDVTGWQQPGSITVHMVNLTNPMAMKAPYRGFFQVGPQRVRVLVPEDVRVKTGRLLVAGTTAAVTAASGGTVEVTVPSILDHEVLALELA